MRHAICVILLGIFGTASIEAAPRSTLMSFSMSGGVWQAPYKVMERREVTGARMATGVRFWEAPAFLTLVLDSKKVPDVETRGQHPTSAGFHDHQWEGMGLGAAWHGSFYQAWYTYGGGRVRVKDTRVGRDRYRYFFNDVGLGLTLYRSEAAGVSFFYEAHQEIPDPAWRHDYGYKNPTVQSLGVAMSLYTYL